MDCFFTVHVHDIFVHVNDILSGHVHGRRHERSFLVIPLVSKNKIIGTEQLLHIGIETICSNKKMFDFSAI